MSHRVFFTGVYSIPAVLILLIKHINRVILYFLSDLRLEKVSKSRKKTRLVFEMGKEMRKCVFIPFSCTFFTINGNICKNIFQPWPSIWHNAALKIRPRKKTAVLRRKFKQGLNTTLFLEKTEFLLIKTHFSVTWFFLLQSFQVISVFLRIIPYFLVILKESCKVLNMHQVAPTYSLISESNTNFTYHFHWRRSKKNFSKGPKAFWLLPSSPLFFLIWYFPNLD